MDTRGVQFYDTSKGVLLVVSLDVPKNQRSVWLKKAFRL
jgi:hypothetical protein